MTDAGGRRGAGDAALAAETVNQVEGYLLWQARVAEAEQRARSFTEPLHWLTGAQRDEVERHYVRECLSRARADLQRVADRSRSLRAEYEKRYRQLRARCLALLVTTVTLVSALAAVAAVGARG
ncbi:cytochrome C oxidase subunit I [Streptomyces sp. NPDC014864]|uniref:cytochrome C oxidase subunit I n=1 Tax=Streptomyces sp. NPDC014864 TaxID=3364924 RepID=UPI0036FC34AD